MDIESRSRLQIFAITHILYFVLPVIFAIIQIYAYSITDIAGKLDALLLQFLWFGVGAQGVLVGLIQIFYGEKSAEYLNWTHSPFVFELGFSNLAFGILGLLCLCIHGLWWAATGVGYSIFLLGAAYGHIYDILINKNFSLGNLGPIWSDLFLPIAILTLLMIRYGTFLV